MDSSEIEVGEEGDSRFNKCGEREGDTACCGASPQSDGVREEFCVSEEKYADLFDSRDVGLREKPEGYCSRVPSDAGLKGCRKAGALFVMEMPVAGNVGLLQLCDFGGKPDCISTELRVRSKNGSESKNALAE